MGKEVNLSLEEENKILKNCIVFILSALDYSNTIYDTQHKNRLHELKDIGTFKYVLEDMDSFEALLKKKKKK